MRYDITLTKKQKRNVKTVIDNPSTREEIRIRAKIILYVDRGWSDDRIAEKLDVSITTIKRVRKGVNVDGIKDTLRQKYARKHEVKLTTKEVGYLEEVVEEGNYYEQRRAQVLLALNDGMTYGEIVDALDVDICLIWRMASKVQDTPIKQIIKPIKTRDPEVFALDISKKIRKELEQQGDVESEILLAATEETTYQELADKFGVSYIKVWRTINKYTA